MPLSGSGNGSIHQFTSSSSSMLSSALRKAKTSLNRGSAQFYFNQNATTSDYNPSSTPSNAGLDGGGSSSSNNNPDSASTHIRLKRKRSRAEEILENYAKNSSVLHIEYWHQDIARWSQSATVKLNKNKNKVIIENDANEIKIPLDSSLIVEHSQPLCKDFNIVLSSPNCGKHRIAVFSEEDGKHWVTTLQKSGAQVVRKRNLYPPEINRKPHHRSSVSSVSRLRPISEGELLHSHPGFEEEESFDENFQLPLGVDLDLKSDKMRMEKSRNKILRRKSTGSASDIVGDISQYRYLPRSASMTAKEHQKAVWYHQMNEEESRGLSTRNTKKKQQSDMSLDSDEVSSATNSDSDGDNKHFTNSGTSDQSEDEDWDLMHGPISEKKSYEVAESGLPPSKLNPKTNDKDAVIENEKLEKFKFLLVNIEQDKDILDAGEFGLNGDYIRSEFDDYPDEVFNPITTNGEATKDSLGNNCINSNSQDRNQWIRKSFEDLDLELARTEYDQKRKNSVMNGKKKLTYRPTFHHSISIQSPDILEPDQKEEAIKKLSRSHSSSNSSLTGCQVKETPQISMVAGDKQEKIEDAKDSQWAVNSNRRILKQTSAISTSNSNSKVALSKKRPIIVFSDNEVGTEV